MEEKEEKKKKEEEKEKEEEGTILRAPEPQSRDGEVEKKESGDDDEVGEEEEKEKVNKDEEEEEEEDDDDDDDEEEEEEEEGEEEEEEEDDGEKDVAQVMQSQNAIEDEQGSEQGEFGSDAATHSQESHRQAAIRAGATAERLLSDTGDSEEALAMLQDNLGKDDSVTSLSGQAKEGLAPHRELRMLDASMLQVCIHLQLPVHIRPSPLPSSPHPQTFFSSSKEGEEEEEEEEPVLPHSPTPTQSHHETRTHVSLPPFLPPPSPRMPFLRPARPSAY
jgi:hypothetical protein